MTSFYSLPDEWRKKKEADIIDAFIEKHESVSNVLIALQDKKITHSAIAKMPSALAEAVVNARAGDIIEIMELFGNSECFWPHEIRILHEEMTDTPRNNFRRNEFIETLIEHGY